MLTLWSAFGIPSTKIPVDYAALVFYVLPPITCYFVMAALAVLPRTHTIRVALWPLIACLALRAMLSVDMTCGKPEYTFLDSMHVLFMFTATTRSFGWTLAKEPLVRHLRPKNTSPSIIFDALDLASAFRGHGWEWSRRLYIPRETRPANRIAFTLHTILSVAVHALICGVIHRAVLTLLPEGAGGIPGRSTLFDQTLPFLLRYLRSSVITVLLAFATYALLQLAYGQYTVLAILFLGQEPAQWPPAFDAPWRATSLSDFWGRRWHQFMRHMFLLTGGYPLSMVLGRTGIIIGAFLSSALWHHLNLLTLDSGADFWWMLVGFGMMGPGVLAEEAFHRLTGRRVGGVVGWVWTMGWLILWGNIIFEGFARAPMHNRSSLVDVVPPLREMVERSMMDFDDWLHTI